MHDFFVADVQNSPDWRNLPVNRVGIRGIRHPLTFTDLHEGQLHSQSVIGRFDMLVDLPKNVKGTHMSRFVEILNENPTQLSIASLPQWLEAMVDRLHARYGYLQAQFPYFLKKTAPISKVPSLMDYDILLQGILEEKRCDILVTIVIPVTSLCPCSKEIANYGAHNQRSHVTLTALATPSLSIAQLIKLVESKASCDLFSILKRADEKIVTERAYDNPKFVEDLVRDIATSLDKQEGIKGYKISSENFESIHNHSAYAEIDKLWINQPTQNSRANKTNEEATTMAGTL